MTMKLLDAMTLATRYGYTVTYEADWPGWVITTPTRPRHPSQQLGAYRDERTAWVDAAALASEHT
jgi:hypothetical protein